ncbi:MAG: stage III sporulation protein SpoIIIAB [Bacillota bacterium]|nr:stage III sporulation protein SpoIIIAB [Bacillota bacterium]MDD4707651.1 stage III sporulation protein SpoIIIAB [Bacillota bacterium]
MIIKLFGCLIIMACSTSGGYLLAIGYTRRVRELRVFQQALQVLESEILFTSTPLPQAVLQIASRLDRPVDRLFGLFGHILEQRVGHTAGEAWNMAIDGTRDLLCLDREDIDIVRSFGQNLGSTDKENQEKSFRLVKYQLETQLRKAEDKRNKNEKLCKNLGFLLGAALVTLLV